MPRGSCTTPFLTVLLSCCLALPAQAQIANGSFETPALATSFQLFNAPATFGGWTVDYGNVDLVTDMIWNASDGHQSVDLNGDSSGAPGAISQQISTVNGTSYFLNFDLSGNPTGGPTIKTLEVFWNGLSAGTATFDITGHSYSNMGWTPTQFTVVGTGSDTLQFASLDAGSPWGAAIDNVVLTVVPEPSACALMLIGLGALSLRARKR